MPLSLNGTTLITGSQIGTGAIGTDNIAGGAITVSKLSSGCVVGYAANSSSTSYTSTDGNRYDIVTVSYTPKFSSAQSDILLFGLVAHGLGPRSTNLDSYGLTAGFVWGGTVQGIGQYSDVFAGSGDGIGYGPEWDVRTFSLQQKSSASWSAGSPITIGVYADGDGTSGIFINRCYANASSRGTCAITVIEVLK